MAMMLPIECPGIAIGDAREHGFDDLVRELLFVRDELIEALTYRQRLHFAAAVPAMVGAGHGIA